MSTQLGSSDLRKLFDDQLPKPRRVSFSFIFGLTGSLCSVLGLLASLIFFDQELASIIYTIYLIAFVSVLIAYIVLKELSKEHRYSQTVYYIHYVNHILRDYFGDITDEKSTEIGVLTSEILTAIANCFSIITGRICRALLVELKPDKSLVTIARCLRSKRINQRSEKNAPQLKGNTRFYNLWYALEGCTRFYHCNNLPKAWKLRKYDDSLFAEYGSPEPRQFLNISWVTEWHLSYKSIIVLPIRFLKKFVPPQENGEDPQPEWKFWGFLQIDCNSRGVFDSKLATELGLAFADLFYTFFIQTDTRLNLLSLRKEGINAGTREE